MVKKIEIIAHRGGCGVTLGNTVKAVLRILAAGYPRILEADIRVCKNNSLVVTHYDSLSDPNGQGEDLLTAFSLEDVRKFGINSQGKIVWQPATVDGNAIERIPSLAEIFNICKNKDTKILLDIKESEAVAPTMRLIEKFGMTKQVICGVCNAYAAKKIKETNPDQEVLIFAKKEDFEQILSNDFIAYSDYIRLWQSWVEDQFGEITDPEDLIVKIHIAKKKVIIMAGRENILGGGEITIRQLRKLQALGVDGVIVNDPALALEL